MCIFESKSEARYNICIVVGRNETFWKKFASMTPVSEVGRAMKKPFNLLEKSSS